MSMIHMPLPIHVATLAGAVTGSMFVFGMITHTSNDAHMRFTGWTRVVTLVVASGIAWCILETIVLFVQRVI